MFSVRDLLKKNSDRFRASFFLNDNLITFSTKPFAILLSLLLFTTTQSYADYNANDDAAAAEMQSVWSGGASGLWQSTPWWNQAEVLESMLHTIERTNGQSYTSIIDPAYNGNSSYNFITNSNDDTEWWGNVWMRGYDLTGDSAYLNTSVAIFNEITTQWDNNCNGGVWWNQPGTYKNAITNELFLLLCTRLHQRTPGDSNYLNWALKEWNWFDTAGGMINGQNLINDGLNSSCTNNGQTTWTYNQGVILAGLTELYKITGNSTYLTQAETIANSVIANLVDSNGILTEPCGGGCNGDQVVFKGVFMRYLFYLYDEDHKAAYYNFLAKNAQSIWNNDRNGSTQFGNIWDGAFDSADTSRQASAMETGCVIADPWTSTMTFIRGSQDPEFNHNIGYASGTFGWACDPTTNPSSGFMQWGPYVSYIPAGTHTAHFRMAVDLLNNSPASLVQLQVVTNNGSSTLATLNIPWDAFTQANVPQDFAVNFTNSGGQALEFRVNWNAVPGGPQLTLTDTSVDGGYNWFASNLSHAVGRLDGVNNWAADSNRDGSGYLLQGPGTAELGAANCQAVFELKVDNFNWDSNTVATISVVDDDTGSTVAAQNITRNQFPNILFKEFTLNFTSTAGHHYDYRVYYDSFAYGPRLTARGVYVTVTNPAPSCGTDVADLNNGTTTDNLGGFISLVSGGTGCTTSITPSNAAPSAGYGLGGSSQGERWYGTIGAQGTCYGPSLLVGLGSGTPSYNAQGAGQNAEVFHIKVSTGPASGPATIFIGVIPTNGQSSGFQYNLVIPAEQVGLDLPQTVYLSQMAWKYGSTTTLDTTQLYQLYYEPDWTGNYDLTVDQISFACATQPPPTATYTPSFTATFTPSPTPTITPAPKGSGNIISIDLVGGSGSNGTPPSMSNAESAGVVPAGYWNNGPNNNGNLANLLDNSGTATSASVTWTSNNTWSLPVVAAAGNYDMMMGYLDSTNTSTTSVQVVDLPAIFSNNGYSVYIYAQYTGTSIIVGQYNVGGQSVTCTNQANSNYSGGFVQAIAGGNGNYLLVNNLTGSGFTINAVPVNTGSGGLYRAPVNAIEIVANNTPTATSTPSQTFTVTSTNTSAYSSTSTPTSSCTHTATATATQTSTNSTTNTPTQTATSSSTNTLTNMATDTATYTATKTSTNTSTSTATSTATPTATSTATHTASSTVTHTATNTQTQTPSYTVTNTATVSATNTFTDTATVTVTSTVTFTPTLTSTKTYTSTPSPTETIKSTSTRTNTVTPTSTFTVSSTVTKTNTPSLQVPVVYPNPVTTDKVTLALPQVNAGDVTVEIFTLAFRQVKTIRVSQMMGNTLVVPLYDKMGMPLANGLYYFRVSVGARKWIVKLLVVR